MVIRPVQSSCRAQAVRRSLRILIVCVAWIVGASTIAFSEAVSPSSFEQAAVGYQYEFPRDHGSHPSYRTEWWYYTGHLHEKAGRVFGFELTFFRRAIPPEDVKTNPSQWSVNHLYLAHFAITDATGGRFHFSEKLSRAGLGKAGAEEARLHAWIDDWHADAQPA